MKCDQDLVPPIGTFCSGCPLAPSLIQDLTEVAALNDICRPPSRCDGTFSVEEFFKDAPWLNIPKDRRGEILIEPLYPRGRLLGGSPSQKPVSKIAALTAARKKKGIEGTKSIPQRSTTSVALLDKLSGRTSSTPSSDPAPSVCRTTHSESIGEDQDVKTQASVPLIQKDAPRTSDLKRNVDGHIKGSRQSSDAYSPLPSEPVIAPVAPPSKFAKVLTGGSDCWKKEPTVASFQPYYTLYQYPTLTNFEAFAGPSPDDIVLKAQNSKGYSSCMINLGVIANVA